MNADTILIFWMLCLAVAAVFILIAAIRGNEKLRDEYNGKWHSGIDCSGHTQVTVVDYIPGTKQAWTRPPDARDAFDPRKAVATHAGEEWPGQTIASEMVEEARQECAVNMKRFKEHINKEGTE